MKQLTILLLTFFLSPISGSTQIWIQPNAVWHYDYWTIGYEGFVKIQHIGDSLIQGKTTKILESKDYQFYSDQFGEIYFAGPYVIDTNYVYAEGDTVFYLQDNQFHKLFDFSKNVGESYLIGNTGGNDMCNTNSYTEVIGTSVDVLGYDFITLSSSDTSELRLFGDFNTRFGGGEFLLPRKFWCDPQIVVEYYNFTFKCFQDDGIFYNPSGEDCEYLLTHLGLSDNNNENDKFLLFPNPVTDQFSIKSDQPVLAIFITDMNGRILKDYSSQDTNAFNVSEITAGMYFLIIEKENGQILKQKFSIK